MEQMPERATPKMTWLEMLAAVVVITIGGAIALPMFWTREEVRQQISCLDNLRLLGQAVLLYAGDYHGRLPPLQTYIGEDCSVKNTGVLSLNVALLYPAYVADPAVFVCPSSGRDQAIGRNGVSSVDAEPGQPYAPCHVDGRSYTYLNWHIAPTVAAMSEGVARNEPGALAASEPDWPAFREAFFAHLRNPMPESLDDDWSYIDSDGTEHRIVRLSTTHGHGQGPDGQLYDFRPHVAVLHDRYSIGPERALFNHFPEFVHVLYMDGHAKAAGQFNRFPFGVAWNETMLALRSRGRLFE